MEFPSLPLESLFYETVSKGDYVGLLNLYRNSLGLDKETDQHFDGAEVDTSNVGSGAVAGETTPLPATSTLRRRRALQSLLRVRHLSNLRCPPDFVHGDGTTFDGGSNQDRFVDADGEGTPPRSVVAGSMTGTLLHLAACANSPLCLSVLLVLGADAHAFHTAFRRTVVHECAAVGSPGCLSLLLGWGAARSNDGVGASEEKHDGPVAMTAPRRSSFADALSLLVEDADVCESMPVDQTVQALYKMAADVAAAPDTELEVAAAILYGTSPSGGPKTSPPPPYPFTQGTVLSLLPDGHGNTALHWAAFKNSASCLRILLESGANPDVRSSQSGWTPLHDASYANAVACVKILLDAGARVDARATSGATPLCFAAQENSARACGALLEGGADPSARCCAVLPPPRTGARHPAAANRFGGYTPLHYSSHYDAAEAAAVLVSTDGGRDAMDVPDRGGRLPLHVAASRGSAAVMKALLGAGARLDDACGQGRRIRATSIGSAEGNGDMERRVDRPAPPRLSRSHPGQAQRRLRPLRQADPTIPSSPEDDGALPPVLPSPLSSPVLRSLVPRKPVRSSRPWNCVSRDQIEGCHKLLVDADGCWSPQTHGVFTPSDRAAALSVLMVGKRLEYAGSGIFAECWPMVLGFCGRDWFRVENEDDEDEAEEDEVDDTSLGGSAYEDSIQRVSAIEAGRATFETALERNEDAMEEEREYTQFDLDD